MKRITVLILFGLSVLISACAGTTGSTFEISIESSRTSEPDKPGPDAGNTVVAYICGAVNRPGVYVLDEPSRIVDLIEAAGGATEEADLSRINLAQKLADGQQVVVPGTDETQENVISSENGKVNLNFADKEELMTLPGIGEAKAEAILAYRQEIGWFESTEEIMNISGIKEKMYAKIADRIEV